MTNVISMDEKTSKGGGRKGQVRDRRYSIRYPFAADAEIIDLESGDQAQGVTSDLSIGGTFVCTSKPLALNARVRATLTRKNEKVSVLGTVRTVRPRIGMGVEFIDMDSQCEKVLMRWMDQLRESR